MELTYLQGAKDAGELPAVFTVTSGDGTKYVRVQVSETTTVTPAGGTSIRIGSSGDFVTTPLTLVANTDQDIYFNGAGSFIIPRRKLVTYLYLRSLGSSVIEGDITGMKLTFLYLYNIGSSLTYGTNSLNIMSAWGVQLWGNTVFATAAEYERLIIDAANGTWSPVGSRPFTITAGTTATDPGWDTVKAYVATLLEKAAWTIIPSAWLSDNGGSWPLNWKEYTE